MSQRSAAVEYTVATPMVGDAPREQALRAVAEAGFKQVELWCAPGHLDDWPSDPAGLRRDLERFGLSAFSVHPPDVGWHTADSDPDVRRGAVEATCASLACAAEAGAGLVIAHPGSSRDEGQPPERRAAWARSRESLSTIAERAAEFGVRIAVENLPALEHKLRPGTTVAEVLELIGGLGGHVGVCLDTGHANLNGLRAADEAAAAGDKLFTTHLQDNDGSGDQHRVPGCGSIDWAALLDELDGAAYAGGRVFETGAGDDGFEGTLAALARVRDQWLARND